MRIAARDAWGRPIDLAAILDGGQTFTWWAAGSGDGEGPSGQGPVAFEGSVGPWRVRLQVDPALPPGALEQDPWDPEGARAAMERLLDLDRNYNELDEALIRREPLLGPVVRATPGIRIVRLAPWEALVSFVLSSHTHIARIKAMVGRLRETFSEDGVSFPPPQALAAAGEDALRKLRLGYRARYLHRLAEMVAATPEVLEQWGALPTQAARSALMGLAGVGHKVADCVLLFGYGRWDAFPIDRWVRRAMESVYFGGRVVASSRLAELARERFGELAALAQAHLFASARLGQRRGSAEAVGRRTSPVPGGPVPGESESGDACEVLPGRRRTPA